MPRRIVWPGLAVLSLIFLIIHTSTDHSSSDSASASSRTFNIVKSSRFRRSRAASLLAAQAEVPLQFPHPHWPSDDPHVHDPLLEFCIYNPDSSTGQTFPVALPDGTGSVRGIKCAHSGVEAFLGIPYAKPPIGERRFNVPQKLDKDEVGMWDARRYSKMCLQPERPPHRPRWALSEDCLTINVFRPSPSPSLPDPSGAKLPVMVWIYGGGLETGDPISNNATFMIEHGVQKGTPVMLVSFNYRLGPMGFLASSDLAELSENGEAGLNNGFHDMQAALLWVQRNIESFGGDKDKVTVYGQSAGAIGISSLLLAGNGKAVGDFNLFRAAILQSGAPIADSTHTPNVTDFEYEVLLQASGCLSHTTPRSRLACLRTKSEGDLARATHEVWLKTHWRRPFDRTQDGWFHVGTPGQAVREGRVAVVPILAGSVLDEGTMFAPHNIESKEDMIEYFSHTVSKSPSFLPVLDKLLALYPDDPTIGSPYEPVRVSPENRYYGKKNMYKRIASMFGDGVFEAGRRQLLQTLVRKAPTNPVYAYQFAVKSDTRNPAMGVAHGSELPFAQGNVAAEYPNSDEGRTSEGMMNAWLNFVHFLDPNGDDVPYWPPYATDPHGLILRANNKGTEIVTDDYRSEGIKFLASEEWGRWLEL